MAPGTSVGCGLVLLLLAGALLFVGINTQSVEPITGIEPPEVMVITAVSTPAYPECSWIWANEEQPDLTEQLGAALTAQGIEYTQLRVYAFGENCMNPAGEIAYFAAMETDFELTLALADVSDLEAMGNRVADVLGIIVSQFPPDSTPGPQPGRIQITVNGEAGSWNAVLTYTEALDVIGQGQIAMPLRGAAVIQALNLLQE
ncbi:MAG: hypothetical protein HY866_20765 [Chloroflexi bacterium]|nr:hypothetical protein [Chloroflexota bacterium]